MLGTQKRALQSSAREEWDKSEVYQRLERVTRMNSVRVQHHLHFLQRRFVDL